MCRFVLLMMIRPNVIVLLMMTRPSNVHVTLCSKYYSCTCNASQRSSVTVSKCTHSCILLLLPTTHFI